MSDKENEKNFGDVDEKMSSPMMTVGTGLTERDDNEFGVSTDHMDAEYLAPAGELYGEELMIKRLTQSQHTR